MRHTFFLLITLLLAACSAPSPAPTLLASTPVPVVSPSPVPSVVPSSVPVTLTPNSQQPDANDSLLPAVERTIDLGPANFNGFTNARPMALDEQAGRLYVSVSPSRTVVLDAESLTPVGELPLGGTLSLNSSAQRLYMGVPGEYLSKPDGTSTTTPAELKLFDTTNLTLLHSAVLSDTTGNPPLVAVDTVNDRLYIAHAGISLADANTLQVSGTLSGTVPIPNGPVPNLAAVDAAIDPQRQRLFVSMNNGIPGSNNGNILAVYDLTSGQLINQDDERSVFSLTIDPTTGEAFIPRAHLATNALVKYDSQGNRLKRLENAAGQLQLDVEHNRLYVLSGDSTPGLKVLDRDLNYLGFVSLPDLDQAQAMLADPSRDRLYVLLSNGQLIVLKGHAPSIEAQPPARKAVQWIVPAPDVTNTHLLYAAFGPDEYPVGYGTLYRSHDDGTTWELVTGLPPNTISSLAIADKQTHFVSTGPGGSTFGGLGVYRSVDGGETWQPASHGLSDLGIARVVTSPDFTHDHTLYATSYRNGLFRSTDGGETWTSLAARYLPLANSTYLSTINAMALSPGFAQDHTLLISLSDGSILRSIDRGETWMRSAEAIPASRLIFVPDSPTVFAVTLDGVLRSDDGGVHWMPVNDGLPVKGGSVNEIDTSDHAAAALMIPFGQPAQVYRLPLEAATWHVLSGLPETLTTIALTSDGTLFTGTTDGQVQHDQLSDLP